MGGLLESIAHFGHHHLDAYRCFRYRKAGRQIDGNQVRAAIDAIGRKAKRRPAAVARGSAQRAWVGFITKGL